MPLDNYLLTFEHNGGIQFSCIYYLPFSPKTASSSSIITRELHLKNFIIKDNFILIVIFSLLIVIISALFIFKSKKSSEINNSNKTIENIEEYRKPNELNFLDISSINKLQKIELIGQGAQSDVIKIFDGKNYYALKVLKINIKNKKKGTTSQFEDDNFMKVKRFFQEYEILNNIDHPNIIKSYGFYGGDDKNQPSILLQYCPKNLKDNIEELKNVERITVIYEICLGMKKVHEFGLIHRDLKPENILLDDKNHVKISDFGISCLIDPETQSQSKTEGVGTLLFMAPELLNGSTHYGQKVDVYSFGFVLFFILTGGEYPNISIGRAANGKRAKIPKCINEISTNLINNCWEADADQRPSFLEIIEFIKNYKFNLIDGIEKDIPKIEKFLNLNK